MSCTPSQPAPAPRSPSHAAIAEPEGTGGEASAEHVDAQQRTADLRRRRVLHDLDVANDNHPWRPHAPDVDRD